MKRSLVVLVLVLSACGFPHLDRLGDAGSPDAVPRDGAPSGDGAPPDCADCALVALEPAIARTGDTITLEGTFAATATVTFPGGVVVEATVEPGQHRATVVTPETATAGALTVATGGGTAPGSAEFRHVPFAPRLGSFQYGYQNEGRLAPVLAHKAIANAAVVLDHYVYVLGGVAEVIGLTTVQRALVNADGTLGAFAETATPLVTGRAHPAVIRLGGYLYVVGGEGAGQVPIATVERAAIAADGALGAFATVEGVSLVAARFGHTLAIVGRYLYVIGGGTADNAPVSLLERAPIAADGALGAFQAVADRTLATPRLFHASAVIGDTLYVLGGGDHDGDLGSVEHATITGDGELGAFTIDPDTALVMPRARMASLVLGGTWYVWGGLTPGLEAAELGAQGKLGPFTTRAIAVASPSDVIAIVGNWVYSLGRGTTPGNEVFRGPLDASGVPGPFAAEASIALVTPRLALTATAIADQLYVVGGVGSTGPLDSVEQSAIAADGRPGRFAISTTAHLVTARSCHVAVVIGSWLYVIGGRGAGTSTLTSIERAPIASDGTLGAFADAGIQLTTGRCNAAVAVTGASVYLLGGLAEITPVATIERAPITAAGELGSFAEVTGRTLLGATSGAAATVLTGRIYVLGGSSSTGVTTAVQVGQLGSDANDLTATFEPVAGRALAVARASFPIATIASALYALGGVGTSTVNTAIDRAPTDADLALADTFTASGPLDTGRGASAAVVTTRGIYVLGGTTSSGATNSIASAPIQ